LSAVGGLGVGGAMVACGESAGCETPGVGLALGDGF